MKRPSSEPAAALIEERILAVQALNVPDILVRIGVLVARRGAILRSAIAVQDSGGELCTLAIVVAAAPRLLARLPLWIGGLPDVRAVQDLSFSAIAGDETRPPPVSGLAASRAPAAPRPEASHP